MLLEWLFAWTVCTVYSVTQTICKANSAMFAIDNNNADDLIGTQRLSPLQVCSCVINSPSRSQFLLWAKNIVFTIASFVLREKKKSSLGHEKKHYQQQSKPSLYSCTHTGSCNWGSLTLVARLPVDTLPSGGAGPVVQLLQLDAACVLTYVFLLLPADFLTANQIQGVNTIQAWASVKCWGRHSFLYFPN